jgi:phage terminase large subunit-like protein
MSAPRLDVTLWSKQADFVLHPARSLLFRGGIGSGKTFCGAVRALGATQGYIGGQPVIQTPNWGMVTAPTYSMLEDGPIQTFMALAGDFIEDYNDSKKRARMRNGSVVLFRSTEHIDRRRGSNLSWWWGDEAAMYRPGVWKTMIGRLREGGKRGWRWLTTTPKGRDWLWQKFEGAPGKESAMVTAASWENPFLEEDVIRDWMLEYGNTDFALQELWGQFIAHQGLIYSMFRDDVHVTTQVQGYYPTVEAGVDWGFRNPGVILVGGVTNDGGVDIVHEEYKRQRDIDEWVRVAVDLRERYGIGRFWCDPSRPDYLEAFNAAGLGAVAADNSLMPGINTVKRYLGRRVGGLRIHESAVWLIKELRDLYQWQKERGDMVPEKPVKAHDHAADALRYLLVGVGTDGGGTMAVDAARMM